MQLSAVPFRTTLDGKTLVKEKIWIKWLTALLTAASASSQQIGSVFLAAQAAAITTTAIPLPPLTDGLYRINYYVRKTTVPSVSSSLTVTVGWTDGGIALTSSGAALTLNTTSAYQAGSVLVQADANSSLTYAVSYASSGTTPLQYALSLTVDQLPS